jgi:hypothetical protein
VLPVQSNDYRVVVFVSAKFVFEDEVVTATELMTSDQSEPTSELQTRVRALHVTPDLGFKTMVRSTAFLKDVVRPVFKFDLDDVFVLAHADLEALSRSFVEASLEALGFAGVG